MDDIFYFKKINIIGGVENFLYYLSKKYNFKFYYKEADEEQIKRLSHYIEVHKYKNPIKCDKFFCNYGLDIEVEAKEKYHIAHCDYKEVSFSPILYDGFKYIGVSKLVCNSFNELTGKDIELLYNPIYIDKVIKSKNNDGKIHLISATRLTREKGLERMQKLAKLLEQAGIDYEWHIYTNKKRIIVGKNVILEDTKLDILQDIANADFLVQLSDCEAYCYSVVESLLVGTPVIVTDLPVYKELELNENNSIICDLEMKKVPIERIKEKFNFKYKAPKEKWDKYLSTNKTYNPDELVEVRVLRRYTDIELGQLARNSIIKMRKERASYLECKGLVEW